MKHAPVDMLKKMMTVVLIFSAAAITFAGDVYSLWPFPDSSAVTVDAAAALQAPEKFWNEKIIVNGVEL
ncbi:MAG: hypothetical protein J6Q65_05935, partial [Lentisphaeria bacterium]|nr:hypothetical protein [Lentisphaeria bacterium]